ncbi:hypothetical protein LWI29_010265 [Acer saccharum]|uniref:NB-ARC domain-containing protein n=1 Tax=Acer saccharum TaxID=4024 RepID=A0AA39W2R5_ACESA|nr:hypothetical protein LWI29_010265 [Acer saccharum]
MVEIATFVVEIAKYLVAPVRRPFSYLWNYKTNLDNLEKEVDKLKADRDSVQLLIKPGKDPLPNVKLWQERTDRSIVEVSKVVGDNPEQANIQCCKGFSCPNLICRYQRGKNAAEKLKEVLKLEQEAAPWLAQITISTNIPDYPWLRSGDGYEAFDSRSSVLKNIIDALCDPDVNMVGIYGMGGIEEAEAWSLFKSTAGMCIGHPDLKNIAPKVAKECGNMPLAIVTIASALKDKEESTWSTALNELKNPSLEGFEETMTREVYTCIKFSYDHLDTKELKEIFLLCSRMGRTYDASIRDLFMYGLGLGYFKRYNTLEEAQCKVEDLVKKLKGNSLLLDAPNETRESLRHVIPDGKRPVGQLFRLPEITRNPLEPRTHQVKDGKKVNLIPSISQR